MRNPRLSRLLSLSALIVTVSLLSGMFSTTAAQAATTNVVAVGTATVGSTISVDSTFFAPGGATGNYVVDTEAYNSAGVRVAQWFETIYLGSAPSVRRYSWALGSLPTGTYRFSQGVFNEHWAGNRYWESNAGSVAITSVPVTSAPTTTVPVTSSTSTGWKLSATSEGTTGEIRINPTFVMPSNFIGQNVVMNTEVANSSGHKVAQWFQTAAASPSQRFDHHYVWNAGGVPAGKYTVRQGVFKADWSSNLVWRGATAYISVGSASATTTSTTAAPASTTTTTAAPTTTTTTAAPTTTTTAPPATTSTTTFQAASSGGSAGNPFHGYSVYVNPANPAAAQAAAWRSSRPGDAAVMDKISAGGAATWLGGWNWDVKGDAARITTAAATANRMPIFVAYNIPGRDCGSYSAGGASGSDAYRSWIRAIAAGIGSGRAAVVLEPDALSQLDCLTSTARADRLALLSDAVNVLSANPNTAVYIDAGHPGWHSTSEMADRLRRSNVANARGFSLNVSNFTDTPKNVTYGNALSAALGGKKYVVDTSRNGNGSNGEWCNPSGRAVGPAPTASTGQAAADAFLWIKQPGESDGTCNGGPSAGQWWADYALGLGRSAGY